MLITHATRICRKKSSLHCLWERHFCETSCHIIRKRETERTFVYVFNSRNRIVTGGWKKLSDWLVYDAVTNLCGRKQSTQEHTRICAGTFPCYSWVEHHIFLRVYSILDAYDFAKLAVLLSEFMKTRGANFANFFINLDIKSREVTLLYTSIRRIRL